MRTTNDYPDSMKNLDPKVRNKAIEIANAVLAHEGYDEGNAIPIAISQAKKYSGEENDKDERD